MEKYVYNYNEFKENELDEISEGLWNWIKGKFKKRKEAKAILKNESELAKKSFNRLLRDLRTKYTLAKNNDNSYKIETQESKEEIIKFIDYEGYGIMNLSTKALLKIEKDQKVQDIDYGKYGIKADKGPLLKYYAILHIVSDDDKNIKFFNYSNDKKIMEPILKLKLEDKIND